MLQQKSKSFNGSTLEFRIKISVPIEFFCWSFVLDKDCHSKGCRPLMTEDITSSTTLALMMFSAGLLEGAEGQKRRIDRPAASYFVGWWCTWCLSLSVLEEE